MPPELTIRAVGREELSQVIALAERIWPVAYAGVLTPAQIDNMLERIYSRQNLEQEMVQGHRFWLAYSAGHAAGYASGYRENKDTVWLKKIYVAPDLQGRGIGSALIQTVVDGFSPARELRLLVNPQNTKAHRYYARQGFTKIGEMPVRMGDWRFDDFLFAKPIAI